MRRFRHRERKGVKYLPKATLYAIYCTSDMKTYTFMAAYKSYEMAEEKKRILESKVFRKCVIEELEV